MNLEILLAVHYLIQWQNTSHGTLKVFDMEALRSTLRRVYISHALGPVFFAVAFVYGTVPKLPGIHPCWEHDQRRCMEEHKPITIGTICNHELLPIDIQYSFRTIRNHSQTSTGRPCGFRAGC